MAWSGQTGNQEAALVLLGGSIRLRAGQLSREIGERLGPFDGLPWSAYLPPHTSYTVEALAAVELGWATAPAEGRYAPALIAPGDVRIEARGEGTTARTVRHIMPPEFP